MRKGVNKVLTVVRVITQQLTDIYLWKIN